MAWPGGYATAPPGMQRMGNPYAAAMNPYAAAMHPFAAAAAAQSQFGRGGSTGMPLGPSLPSMSSSPVGEPIDQEVLRQAYQLVMLHRAAIASAAAGQSAGVALPYWYQPYHATVGAGVGAEMGIAGHGVGQRKLQKLVIKLEEEDEEDEEEEEEHLEHRERRGHQDEQQQQQHMEVDGLGSCSGKLQMLQQQKEQQKEQKEQQRQQQRHHLPPEKDALHGKEAIAPSGKAARVPIVGTADVQCQEDALHGKEEIAPFGKAARVPIVGTADVQCQEGERYTAAVRMSRADEIPDPDRLYDGNGRLVRSHNVFQDWVLRLNVKSRNQVIRELQLPDKDRKELRAQTKRLQLKLSQRRFRERAKLKKDVNRPSKRKDMSMFESRTKHQALILHKSNRPEVHPPGSNLKHGVAYTAETNGNTVSEGNTRTNIVLSSACECHTIKAAIADPNSRDCIPRPVAGVVCSTEGCCNFAKIEGRCWKHGGGNRAVCAIEG